MGGQWNETSRGGDGRNVSYSLVDSYWSLIYIVLSVDWPLKLTLLNVVFTFVLAGYNYIFTIPVESTDIVITQHGWKSKEDSSYLGKQFLLTLSFPESIMETCSVVPTFKSVDEILWCDHLNETSLVVLLHGTICFSIFYKMKFRILIDFKKTTCSMV